MRPRKATDLDKTVHPRDEETGSIHQGPFQNVRSQPQDIPCYQTRRAVVQNPDYHSGNSSNIPLHWHQVLTRCLYNHTACNHMLPAFSLLSISRDAVDAADRLPGSTPLPRKVRMI